MSGMHNPYNSKKDSVCMYYHNCQVLEIIKFYYLQECIDFEIRQKNM